jgi:hypothetical protein
VILHFGIQFREYADVNDVSVFSSQHLAYVPGGVVFMYTSLINFLRDLCRSSVLPSSSTVLILFLSWYTAKFYNPLSFIEVINLTEIGSYNPGCTILKANEIGTIRCFPFFNLKYICV